jgi:NADPH:quinone reductase-like Zn-dependent oxidoreductase
MTTYRAVEFSSYGDPSVLQLAEREKLTAGAGLVRISVRAAGVNPVDWKLRRGLMAGMIPVKFPKVPGFDVAGVVDQVGEGVTGFAVGDEVLGSAASGSYASSALANATALVGKPSNVSWELAAALPTAATTSYRALSLLDVSAGQTIVINGATGGVGTAVVQIALARGLRVIGTASEANHEFLRSLGATAVRYGEGLVDRVRAVAPQGVDAALDVAGRGSLPELIDLAGGSRHVITIADPDAERHGVRFTAGGPGEEVPGALAEAAELLASGRLKLDVARTFPLDQAAQAQQESESGHVRGKLIIVP